MLSATLTSFYNEFISPLGTKISCNPSGSFTLDIAIAYYENGQWISQGWSHLRVTPQRSRHDTDKVVLLNQPLRERDYYFYIKTNHDLHGQFERIISTRYDVSHQYRIGSYRPCFWLENWSFKKYNARYSGNGLDRFCDNVFSGEKWVNDWYKVDVGNAIDYTINFRLEAHTHTHLHTPHYHPPHNF